MITPLAHPTRAVRAGFSLIEMMVTVSMLGIMVGMVAPNVSKDISHSRVNSAARVVAADLEQALSMAGRQRRPVRVVFDGAAKEIRLIDRTNGQLISRRALGDLSEYKLYSVEGSPSTVDLLPHGVATASTIVTLSAGGYSRTVSMTRGGHVRVSP
ncbi:MAG TPA: GspH/FimT family pseudopilin [Gemmatimonadaceae bacterium]|nr:GspH/FimT family pseudopilin [Gemmatimonadaceae bacterium]